MRMVGRVGIEMSASRIPEYMSLQSCPRLEAISYHEGFKFETPSFVLGNLWMDAMQNYNMKFWDGRAPRFLWYVFKPDVRFTSVVPVHCFAKFGSTETFSIQEYFYESGVAMR